MGEMNAGIFELAGENTDRKLGFEDARRDYHARLKALAVESGRPITFGLFSRKDAPGVYKDYVKLLDDTAAAGGRMFAQVHSRALSAIMSFKTQTPFDKLPVWSDIRKLPLAEQKAKFQDPAMRAKLVEAARAKVENRSLGTEARPGAYESLLVLDDVHGTHKSVVAMAKERNCDPVELIMDLAVERDMNVFFFHPIANEDQDIALELMKLPRAVVTFSDSGAHVSQLMDSSLQTHLLAYWVRERQAFTLEEAVRMLTLVPATQWGFHDRGLLRVGMAADMMVFDPNTIAAEMPEVVHDLPAGAKRLTQRTRGIAATVVNGQVLLKHGQHTGALPGKLLRGPLAARV
jgi:N-acyl-D-aspartate/D-glutamate deacylase